MVPGSPIREDLEHQLLGMLSVKSLLLSATHHRHLGSCHTSSQMAPQPMRDEGRDIKAWSGHLSSSGDNSDGPF